MWSLCVVTECGQWVVDLLDCLIVKYPTPLVSIPFGSVVPTLCSIFHNCFFFFLVFFIFRGSVLNKSIDGTTGKVLVPGFLYT